MATAKKLFFRLSSPSVFLAAFAVVIGLFSVFTILVGQVFSTKKDKTPAPGDDPVPQEVKISNITAQGFTISWISAKPTIGGVLYGRLEDFNNSGPNLNYAFGHKGQSASVKSHFVDLNNLQANQTYYFLIKSGSSLFFKGPGGEWGEKGLPEKQKTSPEGSLPRHLIQGQILRENGQAAPELLVFLQIPGRSTLLSTITDDGGEWQIDLGNLKTKDLQSPLEYLPGKDLLRLTVEGPGQKSFSAYYPLPTDPDPYQQATSHPKKTYEIPPIILDPN